VRRGGGRHRSKNLFAAPQLVCGERRGEGRVEGRVAQARDSDRGPGQPRARGRIRGVRGEQQQPRGPRQQPVRRRGRRGRAGRDVASRLERDGRPRHSVLLRADRLRLVQHRHLYLSRGAEAQGGPARAG